MDPLTAILRSTGGLEAELEVVKIDMLEDPARVTLAGRGGAPPPFRIGESLLLEFPRALGGGHESASARLVFEGREGERHRYLVTVPRSSATHLARHLNRRDALRVPPALTAPVGIALRHPRLPRSPRLEAREISTTGVGVGVPQELEERLVGTWQLDVAVRLPGCEEVYEIPAEVRYRRLTAPLILYGLRFRTPRSEVGVRFERDLFAYVMLRQRELER